jgi:hypothetical protein
MLTIDLDDFTFELKDGTLEHVGASNRAATVKLYDIEGVDVREFGDQRVKIACEDESGNEIEVALTAEQARELVRGIELLEADSEVFE